ncbi:carbohydrate ABC transporter permease [Desertihabitans aurantiacus]|uniref:carbohydrate ABC transporter permease n=1 Tax=Desertihabitans aurantiacus TaxID=2282477 RepID=UPI000DF7C14A|nr:carbohydrate ABC transporter permease [Desertihabitans aurantiacus]
MFELRTRRARLFAQLGLTLLALPFALPLVAMLRGSLQNEGWANYVVVLSEPQFGRFFLNSAIMAAGCIGITFVAAMLAAFAFAKLQLPAKEVWFYGLLVALTLPGVMILVPLFLTMQTLGLLDTYWAVILPLAAGGIPFSVLLARNFIAGLEDEIFDAARVDGCTTLGVFLRIVVPLSRPIAAVIVLWAFLGAWNEFLLPLLFLTDADLQAITQVPTFFTSFYGGDQGKVVAASVLITLPVLLMYLAMQRFFERGMTGGALK